MRVCDTGARLVRGMSNMKYRGLEIVVKTEGSTVCAGFPKNPCLVHADNEQEAIRQVKVIIDSFPPVVLHTYEAHGKQMRELENM